MQATTWLSLSEATKHCPGTPHSSAVWRWHRQGIKSRNGRRVYLRAVRRGGKIFTRAEWLDRFWEDLAEADAEHFQQRDADQAAGKPARRPSPPTRREREIAAADARLAAKGI